MTGSSSALHHHHQSQPEMARRRKKGATSGARGAKAPRYVPLPEEEGATDDLSMLASPLDVGVKTVAQVAAIVSGKDTEDELRDLLLNECELVFECRQCRSLFRYLADFLAHKRRYCNTDGQHTGVPLTVQDTHTPASLTASLTASSTTKTTKTTTTTSTKPSFKPSVTKLSNRTAVPLTTTITTVSPTPSVPTTQPISPNSTESQPPLPVEPNVPQILASVPAVTTTDNAFKSPLSPSSLAARTKRDIQGRLMMIKRLEDDRRSLSTGQVSLTNGDGEVSGSSGGGGGLKRSISDLGPVVNSGRLKKTTKHQASPASTATNGLAASLHPTRTATPPTSPCTKGVRGRKVPAKTNNTTTTTTTKKATTKKTTTRRSVVSPKPKQPSPPSPLASPSSSTTTAASTAASSDHHHHHHLGVNSGLFAALHAPLRAVISSYQQCGAPVPEATFSKLMAPGQTAGFNLQCPLCPKSTRLFTSYYTSVTHMAVHGMSAAQAKLFVFENARESRKPSNAAAVNSSCALADISATAAKAPISTTMTAASELSTTPSPLVSPVVGSGGAGRMSSARQTRQTPASSSSASSATKSNKSNGGSGKKPAVSSLPEFLTPDASNHLTAASGGITDTTDTTSATTLTVSTANGVPQHDDRSLVENRLTEHETSALPFSMEVITVSDDD